MQFTDIETDVDAKENGKWFEWVNGGRFKIRSLASKRYQNAIDEAMKPWRKILAVGGKIPTEDDEKLTAHLLAYEALVDWEGITDGPNKTPVPFDPAMAYQAIVNPKNLKFKRFILACGGELDNFDAQAELAEKNSESASAGNNQAER